MGRWYVTHFLYSIFANFLNPNTVCFVSGMEQMEDGEDGRNSKLQLELDDAFRTIHEREMHCQELTWEIKKVRESFLIFIFM